MSPSRASTNRMHRVVPVAPQGAPSGFFASRIDRQGEVRICPHDRLESRGCDAVGQRLLDLALNRGRRFEEFRKALAGHAEHADRRCRADGRCSWRVREKRDLPCEVAWPERLHTPVALPNLRRTFSEHEEVVAWFPLANQHLSFRLLQLGHDAGDPGQLRLGAILEQRDAGNQAHLRVTTKYHAVESRPSPLAAEVSSCRPHPQ
jgi:hypothetical protein